MNGSKIIYNLSNNKKLFLENCLDSFNKNVSLTPKIGIELEFYLLTKDFQKIEDLNLLNLHIANLTDFFLHDKDIYKIELEQGISQLEIKIIPYSNLVLLAERIAEIKILIKNFAHKNNLIACFDSQPFLDDCGSSLQMNFSLHNQNDQNIFAKKDELFFYTIAGMLDFIDENMIFYASKQEDYLRFDLEINRALYKKGKFSAPVNISFGSNNRTTAIRIPYTQNIAQTRIEFRVASCNSDPFLAIAAILNSAKKGILQKKFPEKSQEIFGNAFDEQYKLKTLIKSADESAERFANFAAQLKEFEQWIF